MKNKTSILPVTGVLLGLLSLSAKAEDLGGGGSGDAATPSYIYGIDNNNKIQQVSVSDKSISFVYDAGAQPGYPAGVSNAFAYDNSNSREQMWFISATNDLWMWDRTNPLATTLSQIATSAQLGLSPNLIDQPANAAHWNDAYWFFQEGTKNLNKVSFTYDAFGVPTFASTTFETVVGGASSDGANIFGDIAISDTGIGYAATFGGEFYSADLNTFDGVGATPFSATLIKSGNPSLQLSFSGDYATLYGHNFGSGNWFTVNTATGVTTQIPGFNTIGLRDLGGASLSTAVVPEVGGVLGPALFVTSALLRRSRRKTA